MNANTQSSSLDLLDATLDDLSDLPSNQPFPAGAHAAKLFLTIPKAKPGEVAKHLVIAKFKYQSTLEATDATAVLPNENDEATVFMNLKLKDGTPNQYSEGTLKMILVALRDGGMQGATNRALIEEASKGVDVVVVTSISMYKDQAQMNIVKIMMA